MEGSAETRQPFRGMKALVMGLGLHGGGLESARYLADHGAELTVTDLRDETALSPSIEKLKAAGITARYVLGRHDIKDFEQADLVIKNPGVRPNSPYLQAARRIETDISLFLAASPARLIAVTGSKGKSSTSSAIHWVLDKARAKGLLSGKAYLGGNITLSPLTFLDGLRAEDDVVLELSSWQLGDLRGKMSSVPNPGNRALLKPRAAVITSIMPDHLDWYGAMEAYVADKRVICQGQDGRDVTVAPDDSWGQSFLGETKGRHLVYGMKPPDGDRAGGWVDDASGCGLARLGSGDIVEVVPAQLLTPGVHQKKNLLAAALSLLDLGLPADFIRESLGTFPGIEHRLEFFHEARGIRFYNDTAATIPEAAAAALEAFDRPVVLITGGTDKNLDFSCLAKAAVKAKALVLLAGTGSEKLRSLLDQAGIPYRGPFGTVDEAVKSALEAAEAGDVVALSPGCASFGMFLNEFDRGRRWKEAALRLA
ncbi:UDP-N-acetylmuramoyl-L-alanine--D-glutamate ligase [Treponema primitia ZAS-2]|uniref:UDP-N-acetylmuramoylalanine--D-glutamate ligase n=1 Tax=Treponema primitia (strain ATCC BAA-887 / DSM 12427 / ZAS-2) TaxID=545694 RepID=F5YHD5_TREPZ|nr:UDP-N-acetylmuramoyl-L-alanine--D-glutamate ligase [Treponema primitia]AEF85177.1 UDP-N-acetylmuramoyl-L-alanine--D-glutamate ligase [Treponema primitia ZAS-2]